MILNAIVAAGVDAMDETSIYGKKLDKSMNYFKVAPYARYSFAKWDKVSLFLDGGFGFKFYNNEGGNQFNVGINPGIAFTPTEKISLVARIGGIGYQKDSEKHGNGSKFGLGLDNKINFGVFYNF